MLSYRAICKYRTRNNFQVLAPTQDLNLGNTFPGKTVLCWPEEHSSSYSIKQPFIYDLLFMRTQAWVRFVSGQELHLTHEEQERRHDVDRVDHEVLILEGKNCFHELPRKCLNLLILYLVDIHQQEFPLVSITWSGLLLPGLLFTQ